MGPPTKPSNPLRFMGIARPLPIGHYSGTPRDFAQELENNEPISDMPVSQFLASDKGSRYWSTEFREHADKLWADLLNQYAEDFTKQYPVWCIGQSHIDVGWRWRFAQTIKKAQVTFGNAVAHMEQYPKFSFAGSQPCLFEMVLKTNPELFEKIKECVRAGQFDLVGGCWVESDARMPSGEAFVRQHLYGQRFFLRHFGQLAEIAWFQDSFGFSNQIPQYSARSGMKYFFTNKIYFNKDTIFPFAHFHWVSPDGSRLLTYQTPGGFGVLTTFKRLKHTRRLLEPGKSAAFTYASDKPEEEPIWADTLAPVLGSFYGKGDGGHGPTAEEYAHIRYWMETGKNVRHVRAIEFFHEIENGADRLPEWRDELYFEFHRATLTTHHLVKLMNRQNEWATLATESLATLAGLFTDFRYPYEKLTRMWKNLCMMQMHDVLPGSSVPEVYDDCYDFWLLTREWLGEIRTNAMQALQNHAQLRTGKNGLFLFNPLFVPQNTIIEIPWGALAAKAGPPLSFVDAAGHTYPIQVLPGDPDSMEKLERRPNR
jgi:alpha-mannosidase